MGTYLLITPREDELYHYGVKGMKWHQHKSFGSSTGAATTGMGGGSVEISEEEREIQKNELAAEHLDRLASAMERNGRGNDRSTIFHTLVIRSASAEAKRRAEAGKRKVQEIKEYAKKMGLSFQHFESGEELTSVMEYTPDDLMHFGIKGMKWGIRRFQPYQKGEHVKGGKEVGAATKVKQRPSSGNIIERYKAHKTKQKRVAALKKAREKRKADADFEEAKKKAVESGSIEDLAKFKGKLTNEEYNRAFSRLQNEKKVADMVAANQKTVWDKIDKGMAIVQKVGGYANTLATAKENFSKLDKAFNGEKKTKAEEADKKAKEAAKNEFMNKATYEELVKDSSKHNLSTKEYSTVLARLSLEKKTKNDLGIKDPDPAEEKAKKEAEQKSKEEAYEKRKELNDHAREQANSLKNGFYKVPPEAPKAEAGKAESSSAPEEPAKRKISGVSNTQNGKSYNVTQKLEFGGKTITRAKEKTGKDTETVSKARKLVLETQAMHLGQKSAYDARRKEAEDARARAVIARLAEQDRKERMKLSRKLDKRNKRK